MDIPGWVSRPPNDMKLHCASPFPHSSGIAGVGCWLSRVSKILFLQHCSQKKHNKHFKLDVWFKYSLNSKSGAKRHHLPHQWPYQLVKDDISSRILCGRLHFPIRNFLLFLDYFSVVTGVCNSSHLLTTSLILCTRYLMKWLKRGKLVHSRKPEVYQAVD